MESGQCAVYTRDKNRYSGKCTLTTGIRTVGNVHSGQKSRQCAVYTQDRNQDSGKCTLRTGIKTVGSVHSGNRDSVQCTLRTGLGTVENVHQDRNQDRWECTIREESGQCAVYTHIWKCTLMTEIGTVQWEVYTQEGNQDSVQWKIRTVMQCTQRTGSETMYHVHA